VAVGPCPSGLVCEAALGRVGRADGGREVPLAPAPGPVGSPDDEGLALAEGALADGDLSVVVVSVVCPEVVSADVLSFGSDGRWSVGGWVGE
jgi:hypothetical protein